MLPRIAADILLLLHLAFILFVALGGFLVLRWPKLAWLHIPAVLWAFYIEITGAVCPLTPVENALRLAAGGVAYSGGFVDQYLIPLIYPSGLTRAGQLALGITVVLFNGLIYGVLALRRYRNCTRRP